MTPRPAMAPRPASALDRLDGLGGVCRPSALADLRDELGDLAHTYAYLGMHPLGRPGPQVGLRWWEYAVMVRAVRVAVPAGGRILDVGAGGFRSPLTPTLARLGFQVDALDVRAESVAEICTQATALDIGDRVTAVQCDIGAYAPAVPYDAVLSLSVIEHVPDDRGAVRRMIAALRPGGLFAITFDVTVDGGPLVTPNNERMYTPAMIAELLAWIREDGITVAAHHGFEPREANVYDAYTFGAVMGVKGESRRSDA